MKKTFWFVLVIILALIMLTGCGETPSGEVPEETPEEETPDETPSAGGITSIGMGVVSSIGRSVDAGEEVNAIAQVDNVIVAGAFDAEGRIVEVIIDTAQTRVNYDEELQVVSDTAAEIKTKKELGADYGMIRASEIGVEWDDQIYALEEWMIGKTVDEVKAMGLQDDGSPEEADLATSVTITVTDYIAALEKAYANAFDVTAETVSFGLGHDVSIASSYGYSEENDILPRAQVDVILAAAAFDSEGRVVGVLIDTAQTRVNFDAEGAVTSDRAAEVKTKKELGADYGMIRASEIGREWYEQIASLEEWIVGKTLSEVLAMELQEDGSPADADLVTSVTMTVSYYFTALQEAYDTAR
ncbi:MAG: hypothetical protein SCJ97_00625 [Bacillota bacterium]|nr:hypothetical protein [Bacillota bacterium]